MPRPYRLSARLHEGRGGGIELLRTIWPAPTTPSFLTSKAIARGVEENWRLIAASLADAVFLLAVDIIDLDNGLIVEAIELTVWWCFE
jgi:hypothetical protein